MASTLTRRSAEVSLRALSLGAADYVPKPGAAPDAGSSAAFQHELIEKIRNLGGAAIGWRASGRAGAIASRPLRRRGCAKRVPLQAEAPRIQPAAVRALSAAGVADRVLDRRPAGADHLDRTARRRDRAGADSDHPAHAADFHRGAGRTSRAQSAAVACLRRCRAKRLSPAASTWRRAAAICASCAAATARDRARRRSTDKFLQAGGRSAAVLGGRGSGDAASLALVLTGMGTDGTRGAAEIVAAGGSVIAQDEATSVVWGMPRSVAQAGLCSAVLPLPQIGAKINHLFCGRSLVTPHDYDFLRKCLKQRSGLVLSADKQYLVESRLLPVARKAGLGSLGELVATLKRGNAEALMIAVVEAMMTNESFFFRDKTPFENFRSAVMPALHRGAAAFAHHSHLVRGGLRPARSRIRWPCRSRRWSAKIAGWRIEVIATDLSNEVLEKARQGIYSQFEVQRGLPIQLLIKYFTQVGDMWQIAPEIRAMVKYRQFNLLSDFSRLGAFDLIFCRNVLIYFDQETKIGVLNRLPRGHRRRRLSGAWRSRDRRRAYRQIQDRGGFARSLCAQPAPRRECRRRLPPARSGRAWWQ